MMKPNDIAGTALFVGVLAAGCGDNKAKCTVGDRQSCPPDRVCEEVKSRSGSSRTQCFSPSQVSGKVTNARSDGPLSGARVVLWNLDTLMAVGPAQTSSGVGGYAILETLKRVEGMMAAPQRYHIRVSAPGFLDYPGGVRQPASLRSSDTIVLSLAQAASEGQTFPRNISLQEIESAPAGSITGTVTGGQVGGAVLVVAEAAGKGYSGVADATGAFVIYNVPDGAYEVRGYLRDQSYGPAMAVVSGTPASVDLAGQATPGVVVGKAQIAMGAMACEKSTAAVAARSTGELIPGVRADLKTEDSSYEIKGVPAGPLTVLVSQENDCLIRDPNSPEAPGIDHTFAAGESKDLRDRVVPLIQALGLTGPGRDSADSFGIDTLKWAALPAAEEYRIEILDVFGKPVPSGTKVIPARDVPEATGGVLSVEMVLKPGLHYQWRATALKGGNVVTRTEDRRGQFYKLR